MRLLTAIGVAVLAIGMMSASSAHAQAPPRIRSLVPFHLINQPVPPGLINSLQQSAAQEQDDLSRIVPNEAVTVSLQLQQVAVSEALEALARVAGVDIYFTRDVADDDATVNVSFEFFSEGDLETVLRSLLDGHNLSYRAVDENTLLVFRSSQE